MVASLARLLATAVPKRFSWVIIRLKVKHMAVEVERWPMILLTLLVFTMLISGSYRLAAQENVASRGITAAIKLEEIIFGHLAELNDKFKLRATELTLDPGAYLGVHHHVGPGIRYVLSGEVTFSEGGQTTIYKAGVFL